MKPAAVITGIGLVTPLGSSPAEILHRMRKGETAARAPSRFDPAAFSCRVCTEIEGFDPGGVVSDPKMLRLMGRDAIFAAAAARLAVEDAGIHVGREYRGDEIGLFGATGVAGMDLAEVAPLIRHSASPRGGFDAQRFGSEALRRIRPILSFKILANMPICFVSIFEGIQGPNAIYNPREAQGAHAIRRGLAAVRRGEAPCVLVGGCDVKTHELAFLCLEQSGAFRSWKDEECGITPGEGAAFLVLEDAERAGARGARILASVRGESFRSISDAGPDTDLVRSMLSELAPGDRVALLSSEEGNGRNARIEDEALRTLGVRPAEVLRPKTQVGNLFAAAAALQVGLAAELARESEACDVLAMCCGLGTELAAFIVENPRNSKE